MLRKRLIGCLMLSSIMLSCSEEKGSVGVVDLPLLYSEFQYQQELNVEFESIKTNIQMKLDSLERNIQFIEQSISQTAEYSGEEKNVLFEMAYVEYLDQTQTLEYQSDSIANDFSSKVWTQLNSYMKDYGDANDYEVIIGMKGDGNVMYVKEGTDITQDIIVFSNNEYNGL